MKPLPVPADEIRALAERVPTPFHLYDEAGMLANVRHMQAAFSWHPVFMEYFAVKACPNPHIMRSLASVGVGADCSSLAELVLAERVGLSGEDIMFTSNDTPAEEFAKCRALGGVINLDDISHIDFLQETCGLPDFVCCRFNPGPLKEGNAIIGKPEEAKYGFTRAQSSRATASCATQACVASASTRWSPPTNSIPTTLSRRRPCSSTSRRKSRTSSASSST